MAIIDKRKSGNSQSVVNRQKFIKRYKSIIKKSIDDDNSGKISGDLKNKRAKIPKKELDEPEFALDQNTGTHKRVLPGNKQFSVGDRVSKRSGSGTRKKASDSGEGTDEFSFVLTKQEFIDLYFEDMCLPDFVKESMKDTTKQKLVRSGFSKEGIPPRMDILRTFKQAIGRRIATGSDRFLDDIDLRYKHFCYKPFPILKAHVFFLMDISGSMDEQKKLMAKKFFMLLYLFLEKEYEKVEITFISHTQDAKECTEHEFFYSRESGGTIVSSALELTNKIIKERINVNEVNIYIAQASDGDNWDRDNNYCAEQLRLLLDKVQYFAYIQTETEYSLEYKMEYDLEDLYTVYEEVAKENEKLNMAVIVRPSDVISVLQNLFKKE